MRAAILILALAACSTAAPQSQAPSQPQREARQGVAIVPDTKGLAVPEVGKRIDFGRSPKGVVPALDRELGRSTALGLTGCPVGVVQQRQWGDLILTFTNERFVGWKNAMGRAGQICA